MINPGIYSALLEIYPGPPGIHSALLEIYPELLRIYSALLEIYPGPLRIHTAPLEIYPGPLEIYSALLEIYPGLLRIYPAPMPNDFLPVRNDFLPVISDFNPEFNQFKNNSKQKIEFTTDLHKTNTDKIRSIYCLCKVCVCLWQKNKSKIKMVHRLHRLHRGGGTPGQLELVLLSSEFYPGPYALGSRLKFNICNNIKRNSCKFV